jgi:hypothetical protein
MQLTWGGRWGGGPVSNRFEKKPLFLAFVYEMEVEVIATSIEEKREEK